MLLYCLLVDVHLLIFTKTDVLPYEQMFVKNDSKTLEVLAWIILWQHLEVVHVVTHNRGLSKVTIEKRKR